jgi:hypothetical protein
VWVVVINPSTRSFLSLHTELATGDHDVIADAPRVDEKGSFIGSMPDVIRT